MPDQASTDKSTVRLAAASCFRVAGVAADGTLNAVPLREHTRTTGLGDHQRSFDVALVDEKIDVGAVEAHQPHAERETVVGLRQIGSRLLERLEGRIELGGGDGDVARTPRNGCQTVVRRPLQRRFDIRLRQERRNKRMASSFCPRPSAMSAACRVLNIILPMFAGDRRRACSLNRSASSQCS